MPESGILTDTQREAVKGKPEKTASERQLRGRVRQQLYNALAIDGKVLLEDLRDEDRKQVFRSDESPPGEVLKSTSEERKEELKGSVNLQPGIACLLSFLYIGLEERPQMGEGSFEACLKNAVGRVADENGWVLEEFKFDVQFDKNPEIESWKADFESGDATIQEATELLKRDEISQDEFTEYVDNHLG